MVNSNYFAIIWLHMLMALICLQVLIDIVLILAVCRSAMVVAGGRGTVYAQPVAGLSSRASATKMVDVVSPVDVALHRYYHVLIGRELSSWLSLSWWNLILHLKLFSPSTFILYNDMFSHSPLQVLGTPKRGEIIEWIQTTGSSYSCK